MLAQQLDHVPGELARGIDLGGARSDALARESPDEVADLALLVGERLVPHGRDSSVRDSHGLTRS